MAYPFMGLTLILLVFVLLPFVPKALVPVQNGARLSINLGFMNFQPSEMAKVVFVLTVAWYLRHRESHRRLFGLVIPFAITAVPVLLILKEPDLGSALLLPPTLFAMLIAAGTKLRHISAILGAGVLLIMINIAVVLWAPSSVQILEPHQRSRIESLYYQMRGDNRMAMDEGYQQNAAMNHIASGGVWGYGKERSSLMLEFNWLPLSHNDMIFPVIVSRWGLAGACGVLGLYLVLVSSMLWVAASSKDPFARLSCVGFTGVIFSQATIHIAMAVGLMPITGITLPFISYGGSSLLFTFIMVGLVINFASRRPQLLTRPSFEFDKGKGDGKAVLS